MIMGRADYWLPGGWNMICQVCGFKYKNVEMKLRWDNVWCCPQDWEIRQPQDFVRGVADQMGVPYQSPGGPDVFVYTASTIIFDTFGNPIFDTNPNASVILDSQVGA
jgi:hypothetical protein